MGKCLAKYISSKLIQLTNPIIVILLEHKAVLGRLRLLRTMGWSSKTHRLRDRRKRCTRRQEKAKRAGLGPG